MLPLIAAGWWIGRTTQIPDQPIAARIPSQITDIAEVNLAAAAELPSFNPAAAERVAPILESWAARVREETRRHLYRFRQSPQEYRNSEAYFRTLMMITVLQQDCGVKYNLARATEPDFRDSHDLFIHGLLPGGEGGTCVSMPVLYAAIGRRLGYPIRLVQAKGHVFCRWDGGGERFNIEATNQGLNVFEDEYYRSWPGVIEEHESRWYLRSLSDREEQALFLAVRGDCLEANGRLAEAQVAYAQAHELAPEFPPYLAALSQAVRRELALPGRTK